MPLDLTRIARERGVDLRAWPPRYDPAYRPAPDAAEWLPEVERAHPEAREELILAAVCEGISTPKEILARAYSDVSPKAHALAERAVLAHLAKLEADGLVSQHPDGAYSAITPSS